MKTATIRRITISDGVRLGRVLDLATGRAHTHGLGSVGEPILDFLGVRNEGYDLDLPERENALSVCEIDYDGEPDERGRFPLVRREWADLGVPDFAFAGEDDDAAKGIE